LYRPEEIEAILNGLVFFIYAMLKEFQKAS
jgi:hypothetical protein